MKSIPTCNTNKYFIGLSKLKLKHKSQLDKFEQWNKKGEYKKFGPCNHFDWWAFPINSDSGKGYMYTVFQDEVNELLNDVEFVKNYKRGVELMVRSYGYDIINKLYLNEKNMGYRNYDIRLRKIGQSLLVFQQVDYFKSLNEFVTHLETNEGFKFNKKTMKRYSFESIWPFQ